MIVGFHTVSFADLVMLLAAVGVLCLSLSRLCEFVCESRNDKKFSYKGWLGRVGLLMVFVAMVLFIASYFAIPSNLTTISQQVFLYAGLFLFLATRPSPLSFIKKRKHSIQTSKG